MKAIDDILKTTIKKYGKQITREPDRLRNVLTDLSKNNFKREINILVILAEICKCKDSCSVAELVSELTDNFGIDEKHAKLVSTHWVSCIRGTNKDHGKPLTRKKSKPVIQPYNSATESRPAPIVQPYNFAAEKAREIKNSSPLETPEERIARLPLADRILLHKIEQTEKEQISISNWETTDERIARLHNERQNSKQTNVKKGNPRNKPLPKTSKYGISNEIESIEIFIPISEYYFENQYDECRTAAKILETDLKGILTTKVTVWTPKISAEYKIDIYGISSQTERDELETEIYKTINQYFEVAPSKAVATWYASQNDVTPVFAAPRTIATSGKTTQPTTLITTNSQPTTARPRQFVNKIQNQNNTLTSGEIAVCILCSGWGCIFGIMCVIRGEQKGWKMIGLSLLFGIIWRIIIGTLQTQ